MDLRSDSSTLCAAILHDVLEETDLTYKDLKKEFGKEIAQIVEGLSKTTKVKFESKEHYIAENLRKILLATAKDIRIILIKLADRLHNMRTLSVFRDEKRRRISQETLDIYAPIADKLGIQKIKGELEDLSLRYLEPSVYNMLRNKIQEKREKEMRDAGAPRIKLFLALGGHELVPTVGEIFVLIHDRVPYRDPAHTVLVGATVTHGAHFLHELAERAVNINRRRLAFHPEIPFRRRQIFLGVLPRHDVIALAREECAGRTGMVPGHIIIDRAQLLAFEMTRQHVAEGPGAIALLEILIGARHALLAHRRHRRRPHGLDHHFARNHELNRLVEGRPQNTPMAALLKVDETVDREVDLLAGHITLVTIFDFAIGLERHGGVHQTDLREGDERRAAGELRIDELFP